MFYITTSVSTYLVYNSHRKKDSSIFDYRKPVIIYSAYSWGIGFFCMLIASLFVCRVPSNILITNSFASWFMPLLRLVITIICNFIFYSKCVFKLNMQYSNAYTPDIFKLSFLNSPYISLLLLSSINILEKLGVVRGFH